MNDNEKSKYLFNQYDSALGEQLKERRSQYVLFELNQSPQTEEKNGPKAINSEYLLRTLQNQQEQNPNIARDAPNRPFLTGTPINAKEIRKRIESMDNEIVIPQIIDGKVFFTTHGEADATTAIEGSTSNPNLQATEHLSQNKQSVDLKNVKFSYAQLVRLLGPSTCQRLEREFVKQNKLSDVELAQLKTARESVSETNTAQDKEPNLLSAKTPSSTKSSAVLTAQSPEPNLLSTRTANSLEPNLLSVYSARSPGIATKTFAKSPGIHTANSIEPNLLSVRTANSLEPNLMSVHSARSAKSPGVQTANELEPNLLSVRTAQSESAASLTGTESKDVHTCVEIGSITPNGNERSSQDVMTAKEIMSSMSAEDVRTAIDAVRSSQDVSTAVEILTSSIRSSKDVMTAQEIEPAKMVKET